MKKFLSIIIVLLFSFNLNVQANEIFGYMVGNITYKLNWSDDHTTCELIINGKGKMSDEYPIINTNDYDVPWKEFKNKIVSVTVNEGITEVIGLSDCTNLTSVSLPNSLKALGEYAFERCGSLESIIIPDSVETIGNGCFDRCLQLKKITFGENINLVGSCAFDDTKWFENQSDGLVYIGNVVYAYKGTLNEGDEVQIRAGTTAIASCAFQSQKLSKIYIPDTVIYIGFRAFDNCDKLVEITLPPKLSYIGTHAFDGCDKISEFKIPDTIEYVGDFAFTNTLWYNNQPDGLIYIGKVAYGVKGIKYKFENTYITINNGTKIIAERCFNGSNIEGVIIPKSVKNICDYAFAYCRDLKEITMCDGLETIGNSAFIGCTSINELNLPESITYIGERSFDGCTGIKKINIPSQLTQINKYTYRGCTIKKLIIPNKVKNILLGAFSECNIENIFIPNNVKYIHYLAFDDVVNLTDIYFDGNETEWKNITPTNFCYEVRKANKHFKINIEKGFEDKVNVYKYIDDNNKKIFITVLKNVQFFDLSKLNLLACKYDANIPEKLISLNKAESRIDDNAVYFSVDIPKSEPYKFMLWDDELQPLIAPIQ